MLAVLLTVHKGAYGLGWWLMAAMVLAAGIGPMGSWLHATPRRWKLARIGAVVAIAVLGATTAYAGWCSACQGCDEFWLEWFFICWPSA
jgi:hypothetical protein